MKATGRSQDLGLRVWAANNAQEGFYVEMLAGNPAGAADMLRASYEEFELMGERGFNSTIAGMLAHALYAQDMDDHAQHFIRESERLASSGDTFSQALWRTALAKVLARRAEAERAETPGTRGCRSAAARPADDSVRRRPRPRHRPRGKRSFGGGEGRRR